MHTRAHTRTQLRGDPPTADAARIDRREPNRHQLGVPEAGAAGGQGVRPRHQATDRRVHGHGRRCGLGGGVPSQLRDRLAVEGGLVRRMDGWRGVDGVDRWMWIDVDKWMYEWMDE